jgi:hypothetical protein
VRGAPMITAGYVPIWMPLLEAIKHVQRVTGGTLQSAADELVPLLRDGVVKGRYLGQGRDDQIAAEQWYRGGLGGGWHRNICG